MCLAIPALIKSVEGTNAIAEIGGVTRPVSLALTPEARVGSYVLVHTGFAIQRYSPEEAAASLKAWQEINHAGF